MTGVVWHDLECGSYRRDLPLWRSLAAEHGGPILEVGAGTGRVTLALASAGHRVTALDSDPELLAELRRRAAALPVESVLADARAFSLSETFALCLVPMQTVQLLGGRRGRLAFLRCAYAHLRPGGLLAAAITERLETFELAAGDPLPAPDCCRRDGALYRSQPTAVRSLARGVVLERRREVLGPEGGRSVRLDAVSLDRVSAGELEREAGRAGFTATGRRPIPPTADHAGSLVVMLRA